jgi:threonine/homoserine/homoserine lactone efflux protein
MNQFQFIKAKNPRIATKAKFMTMLTALDPPVGVVPPPDVLLIVAKEVKCLSPQVKSAVFTAVGYVTSVVTHFLAVVSYQAQLASTVPCLVIVKSILLEAPTFVASTLTNVSPFS